MPGCGKHIVYWWCCGYVEFTMYLNGSIHCINSSIHKYVMQKSKLCTASHYTAITLCITTLGLMSRFDMSCALSVRPVTTNMHRGTILRDCESMFGSISYTMCTSFCHTKRESYVCFFRIKTPASGSIIKCPVDRGNDFAVLYSIENTLTV